MRLRAFIAGTCVLAAGCSGGGTRGVSPVLIAPSVTTAQHNASGSLRVVMSRVGRAVSKRGPAYVSPSTLDATLFIDGTASGNRVPCASAGCTINWTSNAGSHTFAVETDDGHTVLAQGAATYVLTAGTNALGALTLSGVAAALALESETLSAHCAGANPICYSGAYAVADADANLIALPGATYDNGPLTVASGTGSTATFAASFNGNTSGVGGLSGPDANGNDYQFALACSPGVTGSFTLAFAPQVTIPPASEVTAAELATYGLSYPAAVSAQGWPAYACASGYIAARARSGTITEYAIPTAGSEPVYIATGSAGDLWFTELSGNKIGKVTTGGTFAEYTVPTANSNPIGIAAGSDGNLWFAESGTNKIGKATTTGIISEMTVPTAGSSPWGITAGPNGNLWFTEQNGNQVGTLTTGGAFTEYAIPTPDSQPKGITTGPDGNLWYIDFATGKVGRVTTSGMFTEYTIPTSGGFPLQIVAGSDGNLWFTEQTANKIGKVTTSGAFTEYTVPTPNSNPAGITAGPDGNLWFSEFNANKLAKITTAGVFTEYAIPTSGSEPLGIAPGPDGNLWFVEEGGNKVGNIVP
jgi:virginiamycin B lyase